MIRYIKRKIYKLKKIFIYSWHIWTRDFDWDSCYLFELMRIKMSFMEKAIREGHHLNADKCADEIKLCVSLIDRISKQEYCELEYKHHREKWGESEWLTYDVGKKNLTGVKIRYPNVKTEEDQEKCDNEFLDIGRRDGYLLEQDIKYLFHVMGRKIRTWWD